MIRLDDLRMGARFSRRLLRYLRAGLTVPEAERMLRRRLEQREAAFLDLVKRAIYLNPASPYRELLRLAGGEYGDVERLVRQAGVEGALRPLLRHGVYLIVGEFKGRKLVIRGRTELEVSPARFRNPLSESHARPPRDGEGRGGAGRVILAARRESPRGLAVA